MKKNRGGESHKGKSTVNQHTANPGWEQGNHWVVCDVCGFDVRSDDAMKTWDGLVTCPKDWNYRQPLDLLRVKQEKISADGLVRPPPTDIEIETTFQSQPSIPGGTFDNDL